jgi:hypothetical protein
MLPLVANEVFQYLHTVNHMHQTQSPIQFYYITTHTHAGTWAEQAMGNLQKIIKAVSQDESSEEGGLARKRVCVRVCEH